MAQDQVKHRAVTNNPLRHTKHPRPAMVQKIMMFRCTVLDHRHPVFLRRPCTTPDHNRASAHVQTFLHPCNIHPIARSMSQSSQSTCHPPQIVLRTATTLRETSQISRLSVRLRTKMQYAASNCLPKPKVLQSNQQSTPVADFCQMTVGSTLILTPKPPGHYRDLYCSHPKTCRTPFLSVTGALGRFA